MSHVNVPVAFRYKGIDYLPGWQDVSEDSVLGLALVMLNALTDPLTQTVSALNAIGSSTLPVPVNANLKSGNNVFSALGSPSINSMTTAQIIRSNSFVPAGESLSIAGAYFQSGQIAIGADAYFYLECDLSGGTVYKPVTGTKRTFAADLLGISVSASFVAHYSGMRAGNYRVAINMGTVTGSASGASGFNLSVLT